MAVKQTDASKKTAEYGGFRSEGRRHEEGTIWFPLDNIGKIFPAIQGRRYSTLFRLAVVLDHPIKISALEKALKRVMLRFPYFQVELRPGVFWYFLERLENPPEIMADGRSPCTRYSLKKKGAYLLRVRAYQRRLSVEFCHALTDGTGGTMFLRSLVTEYFRQCGTEISDWLDIANPDDRPEPGEFRDANQVIGVEQYPAPPARSSAFHIGGQLIPVFDYRIITGLVPLSALREKARENGASVTEYISAALFWAFQEHIDSLPPRRRRKAKLKPLRILVPVNMRPFYPTQTRRNFFTYIDPEIDLRLGSYDFSEIVQRVHNYMQVERSHKSLNRHLSRNVSSERSWYVRIIPLWIKDLVLKAVYRHSGDGKNSTSFSNLGGLVLPDEVSKHVQWAEFIP
ncbi:MAG: hypothetical protein D6B26_06305, partial [Spirochaetaceae bacterium]